MKMKIKRTGILTSIRLPRKQLSSRRANTEIGCLKKLAEPTRTTVDSDFSGFLNCGEFLLPFPGPYASWAVLLSFDELKQLL